MKKVLIAIIVIVILGVAYWLISPIWRVKEVNDALPVAQTGISQTTSINEAQTDKTQAVGEEKSTSSFNSSDSAEFVAKAHEVKGAVRIVESGNEKILRFENFETINGPDLRIYLSVDSTDADYIDLGPIKGTKGNINYTLPAGVDLKKYNHVLVWCRAFSVLFSEATL